MFIREHSKLIGCKRLSKGQVHCFCLWKVSRATTFSESWRVFGFPWSSASGESHGSLGGQLIVCSSIPCSRPELRPFACIPFPANPVCGAFLFSRCWREENSGAVKLTFSNFPPSSSPLPCCHNLSQRRHKIQRIWLKINLSNPAEFSQWKFTQSLINSFTLNVCQEHFKKSAFYTHTSY